MAAMLHASARCAGMPLVLYGSPGLMVCWPLVYLNRLREYRKNTREGTYHAEGSTDELVALGLHPVRW